MLHIDDSNRKWWVLVAMGATLGVVVLDETVVGVALPTIKHDLGLTQVGAHWVINAYLLVFAGFAAAAGKLGDIIGLKYLFIVGLAIFGLASLASGFAQDGAWIISARAIQGIGAAVIFPASMAMMTIVFPEQERGMALGIYGTVGTVFLSLGPLAGGFFSEILSWRWIFWINPPVVVVIALVVLAAWTDLPRKGPSERIDIWGLITLVGGLGMLVFAIMQGPDWGWSHVTVWLLIIAGVIVITVFAVIERRIRPPLIEVDLFRNASFTTCNLVILFAQFSKISMFVFVALYLQNVLGMSPLMAGFALLASVVPTLLLCIPAGKAADRYSTRLILLWALVAETAAILWIGLAVTWESYVLLLPAMIVWGATIPYLFVPALRAVMNEVPVEKQGQAGGISMSAQLLGGTVGMTICGTLFAATGHFWPVFLVTGLCLLGNLVLGWFAIVRDNPAQEPAE